MRNLLIPYRPALIGIVLGILSLPGSTVQRTGGPEGATPGHTVSPPVEMIRIVSASELLRYMPQSDYFSETRRNLRWIRLGRQKWLNYSFFKKNRTSLNPDWPISVIFFGNATVENVKKIFGKYRLSTEKHVLYEGGAGFIWDSNRGVKTALWF